MPVPGLRGVVGGILLIMDTFEVCQVSRCAAVCDLNRVAIDLESRPGKSCLCRSCAQYHESREIIVEVPGSSGNASAHGKPPRCSERVCELCPSSSCSSELPICRELQDVDTQIQQVVNRSRMRKIVTGSDDAILVNRLIKKVDWAVANMMVRSAHSRAFLICLHIPTRLVYLSTRQIRFK
jgi:hypothetical protein